MDLEENFFSMTEDEAFLRKIDEDLDFAFAVALQTQFDESDKNEEKKDLATVSKSAAEAGSKPLSIVDEQWELIDPHPDVHSLFIEFDSKFFHGKLKGVEVKWSPRMTLCAGLCSYEGRGGLCSIRLSLPLLKLRPRRDLVETLLHEMIHAYLFVTQNNKDHDSHGPEFLSHMFRINKETGTKITVYHNFHDEVDAYRTHWWKCNGSCQKKHPFYGIVKRAMNRAPGPNDRWWSEHQATCGGTFTKIREPENYGKKKAVKRKVTDEKVKISPSDIRRFFHTESKKASAPDSSEKKWTSSKTAFGKKSQPSNVHSIRSIFSNEDNLVPLSCAPPPPRNNFVPFSGQGYKLGSSNMLNPASRLLGRNTSSPRGKIDQPSDLSNFEFGSIKLSMEEDEITEYKISDAHGSSESSEDEENSSQNLGIPVIFEDTTSSFISGFPHRNHKIIKFGKNQDEPNNYEISDTHRSSDSSEGEESTGIPIIFEDATSPFASSFSHRSRKVIKLGKKRNEPNDCEISDSSENEDTALPYATSFSHRSPKVIKLGIKRDEPANCEISDSQRCSEFSKNVETLKRPRGIPVIFRNTTPSFSSAFPLRGNRTNTLREETDEHSEYKFSAVKRCADLSKNTDSSNHLDNQKRKQLTLIPEKEASLSPENSEEKDDDSPASCSQNVMIQENYHNNNFADVECPVCFLKVKSCDINPHLDECLLSYI